MAKKLRIGIVGMSEGNGHPYSWSAIFNGYDPKAMKECPFPAIPEYLGEQTFPESGLGHLGAVTHVWTQSEEISRHIAKSSRIPHVVKEMEELIGQVDAVLLARDDAENHYEMSLPFLKAGMPVFIDKPLALSEMEANRILAAQQYDNQIFSCSALRFADELLLSDSDKEQIGKIVHVEGAVPKYWNTYAVHLLEPLLTQIPDRGELKKVLPRSKNGLSMAIIEWENISAFVKVTGPFPTPFRLHYFGEKGILTKEFTDSYNCFKKSLQRFIEVVNREEKNIDRDETIEIVKIIEQGRV